MRILLVEDDLQLGAALARALEQAGFQPTWVRRLTEARAHARTAPAAIVLDINLPDGEGFTLLEEVRRSGDRVAILLMTARDALPDRLRGFDIGADDYVVKPFAVSELIARLRAVLRRAAGFAADGWRFGDLQIDIARHDVRVADEIVSLTPSEFTLLVELARQAGRVVERRSLIDGLWGPSENGSDAALEVQIHGLRRKIGATRIRTVRGSGYLLESE